MSVLILEKGFVAEGEIVIYKSKVKCPLVTVYCHPFKVLFVVFYNAILHIFRCAIV